MIDEFQDTNAVQLEILEHLERDNLFAVGDEFQSIYRFRHADVGIFRKRAQGVVRRLNVNFRSREELLDVLNTAFSPVFGERFAPLRAGRKEPVPMDDDGSLRLFSLDPPAEPPVELHITDTTGWDEIEPRLGLQGGGDQPWRRAEARNLAHRLRRETESGPPRRRHRRARPRHVVPAAARGGAGGAGPADLRRRRPRLLVAGAGPRRPRVAARAREPARRGSAAHRPVLAVPRRGYRRARPARGRGAQARQPVGRAPGP